MIKKQKWTTMIIAAMLSLSLTSISSVKADSVDSANLSQNTNQSAQTANNSNSDQENPRNDNSSSATAPNNSKPTHFNSKDYLSSRPHLVRLKQTTSLYADKNLTQVTHRVNKGHHFWVKTLLKAENGEPVLQLRNGDYISAKKSLLAAVKPYQNPKAYHQIHYTQIKPYGKVGYNLYRGYEGIKTWKVMHRLGTWSDRNYYNQATYNAVKSFQRRHHLPATGDVNLTTWERMGFSKKSWFGIDNYVAPLGAYAWQGRRAHIEAMIHQAYKYLGKPWLAGCSSSPAYGVDCSGLVMQALYAGGISPIPTSSIGHAHPGNEWNSRNLWADRHLKRVPYAQRRRGDLVFYYQPGTRTIWHIAIYLGRGRVIESWPPRVMIQPIVNSQRSNIAGIKRPFI